MSPKPIRRRHCLAAGAGLLLAGTWPAGLRAESFPSRPLTLLVPWPAGGGTDLSMRILAEAAGQHLRQKVNIENRAGAGGTLAMPALQTAQPDGYTLAQLPQTVFRAPHTQRVLWDPLRDTTPILQLSGTTFGMVVATDSPLQSVEDVFEAARQRPGEMTVASNGVGTTPHLVIDELMQQRFLRYTHVPYKGASEQALAVVSGQVKVGVGSTGFGSFIDQGRLRLLATFGAKRSKRWPNVPTLKELGHNIVATSPYGLAGPRGVPEPIVRILHDAFRAAMLEPAYIAELAKFDQELVYLGSKDYAQAMRETYAEEKRVVERLGLGRANGG
ncbi:tripartite tricarboxylate transporter substrate binding protein [Piscinibacter sp. Jin2]|uniref:Tripartite tricarboxylate transporter substrate binding protein n=1 Tax=Aquariibacter lacus TaxID=2801332 RepID=A0A9X1BS76_9BURK|nr:tripartite tricarboxylate transporter substrate binding protein [Piscinibacter lacus]MBL0720348.1 tripartite tricarboxylate transporter substrate binding protein [Piscinibacter lacus]